MWLLEIKIDYIGETQSFNISFIFSYSITIQNNINE